MSTPTRTRWRRWLLVLGAPPGVAAVLLFAAFVGWFIGVRRDTHAMLEAHVTHQTAHPGWSFPAEVWSAEAPLTLDPGRRVLHAKARGYDAACPAEAPGTYCAKDGKVVPRGGRFAEGEQPPGELGWTRPLAMEPVFIGLLTGPDAEIRYRLPVTAAPDHLIAAILAAEDDAFYRHSGVDVPGLFRSLARNASAGSFRQGGSTLTMQVVRNLTTRRERTVGRKAREMAEAFVADGALGKEGVLQMYLDAPYLGQSGDFSICGFEAASRHYWGKSATALTLAEAATLAAILPAPGRFAPDRKPDVAKTRRDRVLRAMAEAGWDAKEVDAALATPITTTQNPLPEVRFPAYFHAVRAELLRRLDPTAVYGAGLQVHTALDVVAQAEGERVLADKVRYLETFVGRRAGDPLLAATALIDVSDGALVAVVDTGLRSEAEFNRVTQAKRQAGSSFKPLVYAMALDQRLPDGSPRFHTAHAVPNHRREFPGTNGWTPRNIAGRYSHTAALAHAIASSHNIATASLLEQAGGPEALIAFATRLGFDTKAFPKEMGLSLGQAEVTPLEMARFAGIIANNGEEVSGTTVRRATDVAGTVRLVHAPSGTRVMSAEAAALTRELMGLVVTYGTGGSVRGSAGGPGVLGPVVGKTGTTDGERDLWFVGATPQYAGALWLGYDTPTRVGAAASDLAAPLWGWWMRAVTDGVAPAKFSGPKLESAWVCTQTGLAPSANCKGIPAPFVPGTRPPGACAGTHEPESGIDVSTHMNLWERLTAERAAVAAGLPPDTFLPKADGTPPTPIPPELLLAIGITPKDLPVESAVPGVVVPPEASGVPPLPGGAALPGTPPGLPAPAPAAPSDAPQPP